MQAQPLIIGKDTVYVHENIAALEDNLYQYDEVQYEKDEYIKLMAEQNQELKSTVDTLTECLLEVSESLYA